MMNETTDVTISFKMTVSQAIAYAQLLKRMAFVDYRSNAANDGEAYEMLYAAEKIRDALTRQGFAPH
jgi:hypothetical protein